jgi:hypothetical protein
MSTFIIIFSLWLFITAVAISIFFLTRAMLQGFNKYHAADPRFKNALE